MLPCPGKPSDDGGCRPQPDGSLIGDPEMKPDPHTLGREYVCCFKRLNDGGICYAAVVADACSSLVVGPVLLGLESWLGLCGSALHGSCPCLGSSPPSLPVTPLEPHSPTGDRAWVGSMDVVTSRDLPATCESPTADPPTHDLPWLLCLYLRPPCFVRLPPCPLAEP